MELRAVSTDELDPIPGLHFLTHVGPLRSEPAAGGSRHRLRAIVRAPASSPLLQGRREWSHVVFVEAANNLSHWITNQVPEVADVPFKVPVVFPRGMGMPALVPDEDVSAEADVTFQRGRGRWRGEVEVRFFRADGSRAETVSFPLVERLAAD